MNIQTGLECTEAKTGGGGRRRRQGGWAAETNLNNDNFSIKFAKSMRAQHEKGAVVCF